MPTMDHILTPEMPKVIPSEQILLFGKGPTDLKGNIKGGKNNIVTGENNLVTGENNSDNGYKNCIICGYGLSPTSNGQVVADSIKCTDYILADGIAVFEVMSIQTIANKLLVHATDDIDGSGVAEIDEVVSDLIDSIEVDTAYLTADTATIGTLTVTGRTTLNNRLDVKNAVISTHGFYVSGSTVSGLHFLNVNNVANIYVGNTRNFISGQTNGTAADTRITGSYNLAGGSLKKVTVEGNFNTLLSVFNHEGHASKISSDYNVFAGDLTSCNISGKYNAVLCSGGKHTVTGNHNIVTGAINTIYAENCIVIGLGNTANLVTKTIDGVKHTYGHRAGLFGRYLISNANDQVWTGRWNVSNEGVLFGVGAGTSNDNRFNAFVVYPKGTAAVGHEPIGDMDVVNKGFLMKKVGDIESALDVIIATQEQMIGGSAQ